MILLRGVLKMANFCDVGQFVVLKINYDVTSQDYVMINIFKVLLRHN